MGSRPFRPAWTGQLGLRTLPRPPDPSLGQDQPCDPEQITVPIETEALTLPGDGEGRPKAGAPQVSCGGARSPLFASSTLNTFEILFLKRASGKYVLMSAPGCPRC